MAVFITSSGSGDGEAWVSVAAIEAAARIAEVEDDGARRLRRGDLDDFFRIEPGAVFHGVQQHFAERRHQQIAIG